MSIPATSLIPIGSLPLLYFKILVEDRRTTHAKRINNSKNIVKNYPCDLIIARTSIQRDKAKCKVAKLCYIAQGMFQIIRSTGFDTYIVRKSNKPTGLEFNFMSEVLYIFPPLLKLCKYVDSSDTRYINQSHTPIVNPLKPTSEH